MSHMYDNGLRGKQIHQRMSNIKSIFTIRGYSTVPFNTPRYKQALKSGKFTINELQSQLLIKSETNQLPMSLDMILHAKDHYWSPNLSQLDYKTKYQCAIYLCIELAFDTGRRISSFVLPDGRDESDHCLRHNQVTFTTRRSTDYPQGRKIHSGPNFRKYMAPHHSPQSLVTQASILFLTQKTSSYHHATPEKRVVIQQRSVNESDLLVRMVQWSLSNESGPNDEFFMCTNPLGKPKRLVRRDVSTAIKSIAKTHLFDPNRFGPHSLRRGHASSLEAHNKEIASTNFQRGGWNPTSQVPKRVYSSDQDLGPYAYHTILFNIESVRLLIATEDRDGAVTNNFL